MSKKKQISNSLSLAGKSEAVAKEDLQVVQDPDYYI